MAYEGHVAGVGDAVAGQAAALAGDPADAGGGPQGAGGRGARRPCGRSARWRRGLEFVNGGGTGSVQHTAAEAAVTEIAAGSGLYVPRLFDNYTLVQRAVRRRCSPSPWCGGRAWAW